MASIVVLNHVSGKLKRSKVDSVNLSDNVTDFRQKVSSVIEAPAESFELVYCGRCLRDGKALESYGVKPGVTIHVMPKPQPPEEETCEPMDSVAINQVVTALQTALLNPAYRNTVDKMLRDREALDNIIAATPGLSSDPTAVAILRDPEMLAILADPVHVHKVIGRHPALGHAAMLVASAITEEGSKERARQTGPSRGAYSLDQMSDEDDMDEGVRPSAAGMAGAGITASQLAAALAAATGSPQQPATGPSAGSSTQGMPSSSAGQPPGGASGISAEFFRQAIAQATQQSEEQMVQSQLAQMRDMGITDEAVARQALQATGGDIQAALELLFGDPNLS